MDEQTATQQPETQQDITNRELLDTLTDYTETHTTTVADRVAQDMADTLTARQEISDAALLDAVRATAAQSGDSGSKSDTAQVVTLSADQWEVVSGSLRLQNTIGVFGLVLLGVLVGSVLWGQFAPRGDL